MPATKTRLTREQAREQTRTRLIDAAAEVFIEKGFHGGSVEEIVERAGYTRGAFYSNFEDKADLFLALFDRVTASQVAEVSAVVSSASSPAELLVRLRDRERRGERPWLILSTEFSLYAMRNPRVRPKFASRLRKLRRAYGRAVKTQFASLGIEPPAPLEDLAIIVHALDDGVSLQQQIDPGGVRSDFFYEALALLLEAAVAVAKDRKGGARR